MHNMYQIYKFSIVPLICYHNLISTCFVQIISGYDFTINKIAKEHLPFESFVEKLYLKFVEKLYLKFVEKLYLKFHNYMFIYSYISYIVCSYKANTDFPNLYHN